MQLLFNVPPEADGVLLRGFLRRCAVSTELARAVKFHGSGFFADDVPILANRRVQAGQVIRFALPADGPGVEPQPETIFENLNEINVSKCKNLRVIDIEQALPLRFHPSRFAVSKSPCFLLPLFCASSDHLLYDHPSSVRSLCSFLSFYQSIRPTST